MSSRIQKFIKNKQISPPDWIHNSIQYETIMGSEAYGVANENSDIDIYGFCIPPKDMVFPHLKGEIIGFGKQTKQFEQYQQHHIIDSETKKKTDITIYGIVKYFDLLINSNPNIIDSIFTPDDCVLHSTDISEMVRERRRIFLHKGAWPKFKGYAHSTLKKIREEVYYDLKSAYNVVRLMNEIEQILVDHDLDLRKNNNLLKTIRHGEWTLKYLKDWFKQKERLLEIAHCTTSLQNYPDEDEIKKLLMECLEQFYGDISNAVKINLTEEELIKNIELVIEKHKINLSN